MIIDNVFLIFAPNIDFGCSLEPPRLDKMSKKFIYPRKPYFFPSVKWCFPLGLVSLISLIVKYHVTFLMSSLSSDKVLK